MSKKLNDLHFSKALDNAISNMQKNLQSFKYPDVLLRKTKNLQIYLDGL